ncbi:SCO3242 family prenyltransferase [Streptomyces sp. NPDC015661]|uniref:SCO3242 family prenyltransferase n=1 Tax=Streptomyces sp. NPDC015661 TaxID=3364961 RepID=UPI0036F5B8FC
MTGRAPTAAGPTTRRAAGTARAWAELLRVSALVSVPGDALAGAATTGARPGRGTLRAIGASLCLYEAGMALNDWADRHEDALERPHRPLPSGRIPPAAALAASAALTLAGLGLASRAGRPALATATALATTVWAYDLGLKHTPAGPATMATARALDLLLGALASTTPPPGPHPHGPRSLPSTRPHATRSLPSTRPDVARALPSTRPDVARALPSTRPDVARALPAAALLAAHTYAVTAVSRHETQGGSTRTPLAALAVTLAVAGATSGTGRSPFGPLPALAYARTPATLLLHAALNPSAALTERAVAGGIRATIPLQAALAARGGASATALALLGLVPAARALARKVSPT